MSTGLLLRWWLLYGLTITLLVYGIAQIKPSAPLKVQPAKPSKELQTCRLN